jgi:hypothetical protein
VVANNYGGEMLYRVYFFSLPGAAVLAAATLLPRVRRERVVAVTLPIVLGALLTGFLFSYYGKEKMNYFSPQEVEAADYLAAHAPAGSLIIAELPNYADALDEYEKTTRIWLVPEPPDVEIKLLSQLDPVKAIQDAAKGWRGPVFYILTDSELAEIQTEGIIPQAALRSLLNGLTPANGFEPIYRNADAGVYRISSAIVGSGSS